MIKGNSKNSFSAKLAVAHRHCLLLKVTRSVQAEHRDSELVRYHDRGAEADAEGINNTIMDASRHPCGSVIQPSKLGCATLTLRGIDALRHRLHFGHAQASLSATLNLGDFGHFCAGALAGATRLCACKHARSSRFSEQSRLPWLGLAPFCGRKPISRSALKLLALLFAFFLFLCGCEGNNHAEGGIWDETENALAFQVVDSAGRPVIYARVRLISLATWSEKIFTGKNTVTDSGKTNASGWIQLHSTSWPACAEVNTGSMVARSLVSQGGDSIQATVREPSLLRGSLAVRGKPWPARMHLFGTSYEANVGQDGSFSFDSLPRGEYALVAEQGTELLLWGQGIISDTAETALMDSLSPCDQDSVLMDDFEDNDDANRLHSLTGAGWWYTYSDSLSSVTPFLHADGLILSEESWNGTQSYHAIYNVNTEGPGAYALCGFDIGVSRLSDTTATYDLSSLDSITFWAKGEGNITMQVYSLRTLQADSAGKWDDTFSLSSEWTRVVIRPDENWANIATYANTITFISEKYAEIWLDQIVFHGISAADIFPFQLRYSL